jgi:hypothetical protein
MNDNLTPDQQLLLNKWRQADDAFRQATFAYHEACNARLKATDSQCLKAFNAQRSALDAQIKAFKWLRRHYHDCRAAGFNPETCCAVNP